MPPVKPGDPGSWLHNLRTCRFRGEALDDVAQHLGFPPRLDGMSDIDYNGMLDRDYRHVSLILAKQGELELRAFTHANNPVGPSPAKVGNTPAGVNDARKVECGKSKFHGFRPANEPCPMCDPEVSGPAEWVWRNGGLVFQ